MSASPGIIMTGKFARPGSSAFQSYIDYMDREEAVRNKAYDMYSAFTNREGTGAVYEGDEEETLDGYIHYMANPAKTSRLFSADKQRLSEEDLKKMKEQFTIAAKNGSVMWQDVFSFDNEWLIQHGYLDAQTNQLNEEKIQTAIRLSMATMLSEERITDSAVWTASIHYNTDNIHVHVATVEPYPTREKKVFLDQETGELVNEVKGYRSRKTLRKMKSVFANQLLGLQKERAQIDVLRKVMIEGIRSDRGQEQLHHRLEDLKRLAEKLPEEKGYQKYGYAEKFGFKKELDQVITDFIDHNYPELYQEMTARQSYIQSEEERTFGEGRTSSENKLHTLYTRLGNHILKEIQAMELAPKRRQVNGSLNGFPTQTDEVVAQRTDNIQTNKSSEVFQQALERIVNNPARRRANEPPALECLLAYVRTGEEGMDQVEREIEEQEKQKQLLKQQLKQQSIKIQPPRHAKLEESDLPSEFSPKMKQVICQIFNQGGGHWPLSEEEIDKYVENSFPKISKGSEYQKEFGKRMKEAIEKIETNPFQHKKNEAPTAEEWDRYFQSIKQSLPVESAYDQLFEGAPREVHFSYQKQKRSADKQPRARGRRRIPLSKKERLALQKKWQKELENRKQFYQLQKTLRDQTQQWRNERFYEKSILNLSI